MTVSRQDDVPAPKPAARKGGRRKRSNRAELLLEVSNRLAALSGLNEQLEALLELTVDSIGCERGTLFLNDPIAGELYSRVAQGAFEREIRILNNSGIAGLVFTTGEGLIIHDVYNHPKFNRMVDEASEFVTRDMICVPIRTVHGEVIGVAQCLNKTEGRFSADDQSLLEAMTMQASVVLQSTLFIQKMERSRQQESEFLDVVSEVSSEIQLGPLLQKIMGAVTKMLNSDRSTLFLNDEKTNELYTEIGQGLGATKIRLPNNVGIAGTVFTTGRSVNIPFAYADLRFDPSFDNRTGYFTRSILCVPVTNKDGKTIGVTQVLNKQGGPFTEGDEARLKAFTAQISIGLENAKLFDDVQNMKNYNEAMLESMSNGVVTFDSEGKVVTCNAAGLRLLHCRGDDIIGKPVDKFFVGENVAVADKVRRVSGTREPEIVVDAELKFHGETVSTNLTFLPLQSTKEDTLGSMLLIEDISSEKRVKSTMARYMDPGLAEKLLDAGGEILGGQASEATVLFSDIRGFTTLTEELGAQGTVSLLNDYFSVMVDCIQKEGGMLDKFIGDAIMAIFGTPFAHEDDADRAMRTSIDMLRSLEKFNVERVGFGLKPIDIGIGLNTDTVVSGNIGSPKRMDYTVIGDGVNLAARLESACKQYGAKLLISEYTLARVKSTYRTREIDKLVVKGKTEPVGVYEVLDFHTAQSFPNMIDVVGSFQNGISLYRERRFDDARAQFVAALAKHGEDKAAKLYLDRCDYLKENPPPDDWDGAWVATDK
ncbi:MAG: GAF domain-containing protein [Alphaproteobacteria bacterium]